MADQATTGTETSQPFNRFSIPMRWGIIWGVILCIIIAIQHIFFVNSYFLYMGCWIVCFILSLVIYCIAGRQQRKAMGGYISFKDAFSAIFIVILISSFISALFTHIYFHYIDTDVMDKVKETTLTFMESVGAPQESIDQASVDFDDRLADSGKLGPTILGYFKGLVLYAIFGFICAAIVKKKKPEFPAQ